MPTSLYAQHIMRGKPVTTEPWNVSGGDPVDTWSPPPVSLDIRLAPTALRLLIALASVPYPGGWLPLTQREIAERLGTDPHHTGGLLRTLARLGYIERARVRGHTYRYAYRTRRLAASA